MTIWVSVFVTMKEAVLPNKTDWTDAKFLPEMVTWVPTVPWPGLIEVILGLGCSGSLQVDKANVNAIQYIAVSSFLSVFIVHRPLILT